MSGTWRLRGYHVTSLLGRGASSEVWRAHVSASGDEVALKRLFLAGPEHAARAHAEAAFLTVLDHPNLVRLHAVVPADDAAVLVLDLADGGSLADLLAARGRLSPGEVVGALAPVAGALGYLHEHGVVHGDVSSANVLFTARGVPLLADLGVARLTGDDADAESTPAYVDPAVAAGCIPGRGSDVFMLGGVALHALTGMPTWPATNAEQAFAEARAGRLADVPARLERAGVPEAMAAVVIRALHADPQFRGTATDFALDLRHSGHPVAVELAAGMPPRRATVRAGLPVHVGAHRWPGPEAPTHDQTTPRIARHAALPAPMDDLAAAPDNNLAPAEVPNAPTPTNAIRRPRPLIPRPAPRRWDRWGRRVVLPVAGVVTAALLAVGAALWWPSAAAAPDHRQTAARSAPDHRRAVASLSPGPSMPSTVAVSTRPATPTSSGRQIASVPRGWLAALRALDSVRARAFATRDAALLRRVYVTGPLLSADIATLRRTVPAGCRLTGATTRFDAVRVRAGPTSARITTRATLAASTLSCPGRGDRSAAGAGPAQLVIRLVRTGGVMRIAEQRLS